MTHTIGGLRIDEQARVLRADGAPVGGLYAAGADAGGIFTGGYGSGLAAALVFGRIAAENRLSEAVASLQIPYRGLTPLGRRGEADERTSRDEVLPPRTPAG